MQQFPIKTVSALTGVNPITLRAWERRYSLVEPMRTASGHRLYSAKDVETIRRALALTRDGVAMAQVKQALESQPAAIAPAPGKGAWPDYRRRFAAAIAAFDEAGLEAVYNEALALHSVDTVDRMLLLPVLAALGTRWNTVAGGVAEEHFFSAYVRNRIGARFHHRRPLEDGPKILAACAPGELHEVGLLLFALAAHGAGIRVVLLGTNVPFVEVAAGAHRAQCDAVVISNTIERNAADFYGDLATLVRAAKRPVYVGGHAASARDREIRATGAVPLPLTIEHAVRRLTSDLTQVRPRR